MADPSRRPTRGPDPRAARALAHTPFLSVLSSGGLLVLCLTMGTLVACRGEGPTHPDVAVSIDGEEVPYSEFERFLDRNAGEEIDLTAEVQSPMLDLFVDELILIRTATERGWVGTALSGTSDPGDPREAAAFLLRSDPELVVSPAEIEAYYRAHASRYQRPRRVRLAQILVGDRELAIEARDALAAGEPFEEVAERLSEGPRAHLGGDQGFFSRKELPTAWADLIFALEEGEVSEVLSAEYGFHLFTVSQIQPETELTLEEARDEIHAILGRRKTDQRYEEILEAARESYNVEIFDENLPFEYRGRYRDQPLP